MSLNLAALSKPLLDGVVSAFHAHDDPTSAAVGARRVAASLGVPVDEVHALLDQ